MFAICDIPYFIPDIGDLCLFKFVSVVLEVYRFIDFTIEPTFSFLFSISLITALDDEI